MTNDYRAMCAELVDELEDWIFCDDEDEIADAYSLIDRARALLAQPEPEGLTEAQQDQLTPPDYLVFRWHQDWADANVTWDVGKRFDRYDQLRYVASQAAIWGKKTMTELFPAISVAESPDAKAIAAAALEAAADQVVPEEDAMPLNLAHRVRRDALQSVRHQLLAMAAELKAQQ